jgi:O-methyltransferase involved in polyketide biosynthesis
MFTKEAVELGHVQQTLLLPLWGRAVETRKRHPLLKDETAAKIVDNIDYDFSAVARSVHDVTQFEWIARSIHIDRAISAFLEKHPRATIVNVGCGLDTTFDRIDNGSLLWYDLDLPDVIELRRKFIPEHERRKFLACSFLDESWFDRIRIEDHVVFVAAGVLYYFEEGQVREIFGKLSHAFSSSEFIFDAASPIGVKAANEKLIQKVGLDERSFLRWGMRSTQEMRQWNMTVDWIREYPMFKNLKQGLSIRNKIVSSLSDHYKMMYMVHLKFQ